MGSAIGLADGGRSRDTQRDDLKDIFAILNVSSKFFSLARNSTLSMLFCTFPIASGNRRANTKA